MSFQRAFTIVELMLVLALLTITASLAIPVYQEYVTEARIQSTVQDIRKIELMIVDHRLSGGAYPADLTVVGADTILDPWGNPYQYLDVSTAPPGQARKDKSLVPVNTDFDLYSMGPDGATTPPFTAAAARDDIIRCANGDYVGVADDF